MSKFEIKKLKCEKCGVDFECKVWSSINVQMNPELKEAIINGKIFNFICPKCGHKHFIINPILYHDMERKYMINFNEFGILMYDRDIFDTINDFDKLSKEYKYYGVQSPRDLIEKIWLLDSGYEPNIIEIMKYFYAAQYTEEMEDRINFRPVRDYFIHYNKDNKLSIVLDVSTNERARFIPLEIDDKLYNFVKNEFASDLTEIDGFIFDKKAVRKLMNFSKEEKSLAKQYIYEFLVCVTRNGSYKFVFVPPLNEGKFSIEDNVAITLYDEKRDKYNIEMGSVVKIIHMTDFVYPYEIDDLDCAIYKTTPLELTTVLNSDDECNNDEFREALKLYKDNKYNNDYLPYDLIESKNAIIGTISTLKLSNEELLELLENETFDIENQMIQSRFASYTDDKNNTYLSVFLDQSDIKSKDISKSIYTFNDILKLFFNLCDKYSGICINPDTNNIIIPTSTLIDYSIDKIMTRKNHMEAFLKSLNEKEIKFLGKKRFDTIYKIYIEEKNLETIKTEDNLTNEDFNDRLGYGYSLIKRIILTRLNNDNIYYSFSEN